MASYFHLIFEFVRISILASAYGSLIWIIVAKVFKIEALKIGHFAILVFVALFIWRISYWRNNGLGDSARVPLTSKYQIFMIDFYSAGINDNNRRLIFGIRKLYLEDELVYGQTDENFLIFNSNSGTLRKALSEQQFKANNGKLDQLLTLNDFHRDYWSLMVLLFL